MLSLPSCKDVTELASRKLDEELNWQQRSRLKIHLAMCKSCQNYLHKMALTSDAIKLWFKRESIPDEIKQTITQHFRDQNKQ